MNNYLDSMQRSLDTKNGSLTLKKDIMESMPIPKIGLIEYHHDGIYSIEITKKLALEFIRIIELTKEPKELTKTFQNFLKRKLLSLHDYNCCVAEKNSKYPWPLEMAEAVRLYIEKTDEIFCFYCPYKSDENDLENSTLRFLITIFNKAINFNEPQINNDNVYSEVFRFLASVRKDYYIDSRRTLIKNMMEKLLSKIVIAPHLDEILGKNIPHPLDSKLVRNNLSESILSTGLIPSVKSIIDPVKHVPSNLDTGQNIMNRGREILKAEIPSNISDVEVIDLISDDEDNENSALIGQKSCSNNENEGVILIDSDDDEINENVEDPDSSQALLKEIMATHNARAETQNEMMKELISVSANRLQAVKIEMSVASECSTRINDSAEKCVEKQSNSIAPTLSTAETSSETALIEKLQNECNHLVTSSVVDTVEIFESCSNNLENNNEISSQNVPTIDRRRVTWGTVKHIFYNYENITESCEMVMNLSDIHKKDENVPVKQNSILSTSTDNIQNHCVSTENNFPENNQIDDVELKKQNIDEENLALKKINKKDDSASQTAKCTEKIVQNEKKINGNLNASFSELDIETVCDSKGKNGEQITSHNCPINQDEINLSEFNKNIVEQPLEGIINLEIKNDRNGQNVNNNQMSALTMPVTDSGSTCKKVLEANNDKTNQLNPVGGHFKNSEGISDKMCAQNEKKVFLADLDLHEKNRTVTIKTNKNLRLKTPKKYNDRFLKKALKKNLLNNKRTQNTSSQKETNCEVTDKSESNENMFFDRPKEILKSNSNIDTPKLVEPNASSTNFQDILVSSTSQEKSNAVSNLETKHIDGSILTKLGNGNEINNLSPSKKRKSDVDSCPEANPQVNKPASEVNNLKPSKLTQSSESGETNLESKNKKLQALKRKQKIGTIEENSDNAKNNKRKCLQKEKSKNKTDKRKNGSLSNEKTVKHFQETKIQSIPDVKCFRAQTDVRNSCESSIVSSEDVLNKESGEDPNFLLRTNKSVPKKSNLRKAILQAEQCIKKSVPNRHDLIEDLRAKDSLNATAADKTLIHVNQSKISNLKIGTTQSNSFEEIIVGDKPVSQQISNKTATILKNNEREPISSQEDDKFAPIFPSKNCSPFEESTCQETFDTPANDVPYKDSTAVKLSALNSEHNKLLSTKICGNDFITEESKTADRELDIADEQNSMCSQSISNTANNKNDNSVTENKELPKFDFDKSSMKECNVVENNFLPKTIIATESSKQLTEQKSTFLEAPSIETDPPPSICRSNQEDVKIETKPLTIIIEKMPLSKEADISSILCNEELDISKEPIINNIVDAITFNQFEENKNGNGGIESADENLFKKKKSFSIPTKLVESSDKNNLVDKVDVNLMILNGFENGCKYEVTDKQFHTRNTSDEINKISGIDKNKQYIVDNGSISNNGIDKKSIINNKCDDLHRSEDTSKSNAVICEQIESHDSPVDQGMKCTDYKVSLIKKLKTKKSSDSEIIFKTDAVSVDKEKIVFKQNYLLTPPLNNKPKQEKIIPQLSLDTRSCEEKNKLLSKQHGSCVQKPIELESKYEHKDSKKCKSFTKASEESRLSETLISNRLDSFANDNDKKLSIKKKTALNMPVLVDQPNLTINGSDDSLVSTNKKEKLSAGGKRNLESIVTNLTSTLEAKKNDKSQIKSEKIKNSTFDKNMYNKNKSTVSPLKIVKHTFHERRKSVPAASLKISSLEEKLADDQAKINNLNTDPPCSPVLNRRHTIESGQERTDKFNPVHKHPSRTEILDYASDNKNINVSQNNDVIFDKLKKEYERSIKDRNGKKIETSKTKDELIANDLSGIKVRDDDDANLRLSNGVNHYEDVTNLCPVEKSEINRTYTNGYNRSKTQLSNSCGEIALNKHMDVEQNAHKFTSIDFSSNWSENKDQFGELIDTELKKEFKKKKLKKVSENDWMEVLNITNSTELSKYADLVTVNTKVNDTNFNKDSTFTQFSEENEKADASTIENLSDSFLNNSQETKELFQKQKKDAVTNENYTESVGTVPVDLIASITDIVPQHFEFKKHGMSIELEPSSSLLLDPHQASIQDNEKPEFAYNSFMDTDNIDPILITKSIVDNVVLTTSDAENYMKTDYLSENIITSPYDLSVSRNETVLETPIIPFSAVTDDMTIIESTHCSATASTSNTSSSNESQGRNKNTLNNDSNECNSDADHTYTAGRDPVFAVRSDEKNILSFENPTVAITAPGEELSLMEDSESDLLNSELDLIEDEKNIKSNLTFSPKKFKEEPEETYDEDSVTIENPDDTLHAQCSKAVSDLLSLTSSKDENKFSMSQMDIRDSQMDIRDLNNSIFDPSTESTTSHNNISLDNGKVIVRPAYEITPQSDSFDDNYDSSNIDPESRLSMFDLVKLRSRPMNYTANKHTIDNILNDEIDNKKKNKSSLSNSTEELRWKRKSNEDRSSYSSKKARKSSPINMITHSRCDSSGYSSSGSKNGSSAERTPSEKKSRCTVNSADDDTSSSDEECHLQGYYYAGKDSESTPKSVSTSPTKQRISQNSNKHQKRLCGEANTDKSYDYYSKQTSSPYGSKDGGSSRSQHSFYEKPAYRYSNRSNTVRQQYYNRMHKDTTSTSTNSRCDYKTHSSYMSGSERSSNMCYAQSVARTSANKTVEPDSRREYSRMSPRRESNRLPSKKNSHTSDWGSDFGNYLGSRMPPRRDSFRLTPQKNSHSSDWCSDFDNILDKPKVYFPRGEQ